MSSTARLQPTDNRPNGCGAVEEQAGKAKPFLYRAELHQLELVLCLKDARNFDTPLG